MRWVVQYNSNWIARDSELKGQYLVTFFDYMNTKSNIIIAQKAIAWHEWNLKGGNRLQRQLLIWKEYWICTAKVNNLKK